MFRVLSAVLALCMMVSTSLAAAPPGFRLVCRNGVCGYERVVQPQLIVVPQTSPRTVTIDNATYFETTPIITTTTFQTTPVSTGQTCQCMQNGVCPCDPALCACPGCVSLRSSQASLAAVSVTTYQSGWTSTSNPQMFVSGMYVMHTAGRAATRWAARGVRHGWH